MVIDGADIWIDVRQTVIETGPVRVLRRIVKAGEDVEGPLRMFVDGEDAAELLLALGKPLPKRVSAQEAAVERLMRLATTAGRPAPQADAVVLRFFDVWAATGHDSGAVVAGTVIRALGRQLAALEFDSGYPGSAQVMRAYAFGGAIVVVNDDYGVYDRYGQIEDVFCDWKEFTGARIYGRAVTRDLRDALTNVLEQLKANVDN